MKWPQTSCNTYQVGNTWYPDIGVIHAAVCNTLADLRRITDLPANRNKKPAILVATKISM